MEALLRNIYSLIYAQETLDYEKIPWSESLLWVFSIISKLFHRDYSCFLIKGCLPVVNLHVRPGYFLNILPQHAVDIECLVMQLFPYNPVSSVPKTLCKHRCVKALLVFLFSFSNQSAFYKFSTWFSHHLVFNSAWTFLFVLTHAFLLFTVFFFFFFFFTHTLSPYVFPCDIFYCLHM